jgi:hypothetical protein
MRLYSKPELLDGALPICDFGCGYLHWLVVTGPQAGEIWYDARDCYWGLEPVLIEGKRARFSTWFAAWLEHECDLAEGRPARWWTTRMLEKTR